MEIRISFGKDWLYSGIDRQIRSNAVFALSIKGTVTSGMAFDENHGRGPEQWRIFFYLFIRLHSLFVDDAFVILTFHWYTFLPFLAFAYSIIDSVGGCDVVFDWLASEIHGCRRLCG